MPPLGAPQVPDCCRLLRRVAPRTDRLASPVPIRVPICGSDSLFRPPPGASHGARNCLTQRALRRSCARPTFAGNGRTWNTLRTCRRSCRAQRTLPRMLRRQAALYGSRRLVEIGAHAWSFSDTLDMAARFGGTLLAAGIERDDRVAADVRQPGGTACTVYLGCGLDRRGDGADQHRVAQGPQVGILPGKIPGAKLLVARKREFAGAISASRKLRRPAAATRSG